MMVDPSETTSEMVISIVKGVPDLPPSTQSIFDTLYTYNVYVYML